MDLGLLLSGVPLAAIPPGGPPGKANEAPCVESESEFSTALQQAEGKSSGEAVENEPNAQPQELDSKEDIAENAVLALNFAVSPSLVATHNLSVLEHVSPVIPTTPATGEVTDAPVLLQVSGAQLERGINAIAEDLNIVSVSSVCREPGSEAFEEMAGQEQMMPSMPEVTSVVPQEVSDDATKPELKAVIDSGDQESMADETSIEVGFYAAGDSNSSEDDQPMDQQQQGSGFSQAPAISHDVAEKVEQGSGMTSAERKAVVHQLTTRIETLAANSVRNEVTIRMEPAELGSVIVHLARDADGMMATLSASNENLHQALRESRNDLAASLTARQHSPVRVEVISPDSTSTGTSTNSQRESGNGGQQPQRQQNSQRFEKVSQEVVAQPRRIKTTQIDMEI